MERDYSKPLNLELVEDAQLSLPEPTLMFRHFGGVKTVAEHERLNKLYKLVYAYMKAGEWHTLAEISRATGGSEASCSARLRDFRKYGFGSHTVNREKLGPGLYTYQLQLNPKTAEEEARRYYHAKNGPGPFKEAV